MADDERERIEAWVEEIRTNPGIAFRKRCPARRELAKRGKAALDAVLDVLRKPTPPNVHWRDLADAIHSVLWAIAERDATPFVKLLRDDDAQPHVVSVLAAGKKSVVVEPLIAVMQHDDAFVRSAAAGALISLRAKQAVPVLVKAIRDRSSDVRFLAVSAVNTIAAFQDPAAIPELERLLTYKRLSPGTRTHAEEALQRLRERVAGRTVTQLNYSWTDFGDEDLLNAPPMPGLEELDLSETPVTDRGLRGLKAKFPNLRRLDLNNTEATGNGMRSVARLEKLESLDIGGIGYEGRTGLRSLSRLPSLRELDLRGTLVADRELSNLVAFAALESLKLMVSTGDAGLAHVGRVHELKELLLYDLSYTDEGFEHLAGLARLERLTLDRCPVSVAVVRTIAKLRRLTHLRLRCADLTPPQLDFLHTRLPDCNIET